MEWSTNLRFLSSWPSLRSVFGLFWAKRYPRDGAIICDTWRYQILTLIGIRNWAEAAEAVSICFEVLTCLASSRAFWPSDRRGPATRPLGPLGLGDALVHSMVRSDYKRSLRQVDAQSKVRLFMRLPGASSIYKLYTEIQAQSSTTIYRQPQKAHTSCLGMTIKLCIVKDDLIFNCVVFNPLTLTAGTIWRHFCISSSPRDVL